jgi:hypothetical protein
MMAHIRLRPRLAHRLFLESDYRWEGKALQCIDAPAARAQAAT